MELKVNALMLRATDYKDNDKMLTLYSVEKGLISAGLKGVKKAGAKLLFAAQPFCFAEYILNVKGERMTVTGASEIESFYNLRLDIFAFYSATVIAEYLIKCGSEEGDEQLFMLVATAVKRLNFENEDKLEVLCSFLMKAMEIEGYGIRCRACAKCGGGAHLGEFAYFDFEKGALYCEECADSGATRILSVTAEAMQCVFSGEPCEKQKLKYLLKFLNYYLELKMGVRLRSADELLQL